MPTINQMVRKGREAVVDRSDSPRRAVPHHTRKAGFRWCPGQTEVAVEVRSKTTQIAFPDRHEAVPAFPGISAGTGVTLRMAAMLRGELARGWWLLVCSTRRQVRWGGFPYGQTRGWVRTD